MRAAFLIERTTRDLKGRLGWLIVDQRTATDMADLGQAMMLGNCDLDRTVKKIARAIRNLVPTQCIVVCHSYDLADQIAEESGAVGTNALLLWNCDKLPKCIGDFSAIITVPENLYRLREAVANKVFNPPILFLFDPNGTTFRGRAPEEGGGKRAGNISNFRAACLAKGCQILTVVCVSSTPAAFSLDATCHSLGVEALVYADGSTLRTELSHEPSVTVEVEQVSTEADSPNISPLDAPVTSARRAKSRVLIHVAGQASAANLLDQLATLRGYPTLSLVSFCNNPGPRSDLFPVVDREALREVVDELARKVSLINKQVVVLQGAEEFYSHFGPDSALYVIGSANTPSLLTIPGPRGLSAEQIHDVCRDVQRVHPDYVLPSLYESEGHHP